MSSYSRRGVAAAVALLLVIDSWVLAGCGSSLSDELTKGPGMLYFYAEW